MSHTGLAGLGVVGHQALDYEQDYILSGESIS